MPRTANDKAWVDFADKMTEEGELRRDETPLGDAELNLRFLRGDQHPVNKGPASPYRAESSQYRFTLNLIKSVIERKTALITDSRPQIDIVPFTRGKKDSAEVVKNAIIGLWEEQNFDASSAREMVRAATIGCTVCLPIYNPQARWGKGDIEFQFHDPRNVVVDPSITKAVDVQSKAQFLQVKEVVDLNTIRESYKARGAEVSADVSWSQFPKQAAKRSVYRSIVSAMSRPWKLDKQEFEESSTPRAELRHTYFRDWQRNAMGEPVFSLPRYVRYVVDAGGIVLKDEKQPYWHGQIPGHLFDWGIELEHPFGMSEGGGLRRIQYTLNRIVGQVMENVLLTNKVRAVADTDAVDAQTWAKIAENQNGMFIRKRMGRSFEYKTPENVLPAYILPLIQFLVQAIDLASGMTEAAQGRSAKGMSGFAIENLQIATQSIIRLQARAFENWLERIFQQVVALIFQYFDTERVFAYTGPQAKLLQYDFDRKRLLAMDAGGGEMKPEEAWKEFRFRVIPTSSLAMTRVQRGLMASNLYGIGLVPGIEVLRMAEYPNPQETLDEARKEQAAGFGPQPKGGGKNGNMQKVPGTVRRSAAAV